MDCYCGACGSVKVFRPPSTAEEYVQLNGLASLVRPFAESNADIELVPWIELSDGRGLNTFDNVGDVASAQQDIPYERVAVLTRLEERQRGLLNQDRVLTRGQVTREVLLKRFTESAWGCS